MKKTTILIIEDEPGSLQVLTNILKGQGYNILSAVDGETALNIISTQVIDLILCDLILPTKISGMDIVKQVKEDHPRLPIITMTAYAKMFPPVDLINAGAYYYVSKPLDYEKLQFMIAKALDQAKMEAELESLRSKTRNSTK